MASTLGFFTQNELDAVVGYRRRRQRLIEGGVLPRGQHVKTFGQETIIFPEFIAAGLVVERPTAQDAQLLGYVAAAAERLYATPSFVAMTAVVRAVLNAHKGWRLDDLVTALVERAGGELQAWRAQAADAERELAEAGIRLSIDLGRIEDVSDAGYRIALADTGELISVAINAARTTLPAGMWVTHDLIEFGARKGEVLVPTVAPDKLAGMVEDTDAAKTEDAEWEEMFGSIDFQPVVVPVVRDSADERERSRGDLVRPKRRLQVRASPALYANANTMARRHGPAAAP